MKTIRNVIYHGMMNYEIVFYTQEGQPYVGARHMYGTIENPHGMYSVPVTKDYGNALFLALKSTKTVSKKGYVYYSYEKALEKTNNEKRFKEGQDGAGSTAPC